MRLLDRYLFRELLTPLAVCIVGIQSIIIFATVFSDAGKIQEAKLHFFETLEYAGAASMDTLTVVLPVALLLALLYALTHHSRFNEITAMRAAGISLWRICVPYFIVGLVMSGVVFELNEHVVPRCLEWKNEVLHRTNESATAGSVPYKLGLINGRAHREWIVEDYHVATGEMFGVTVIWTATNGADMELDANRAMRTNEVWTFYETHELVNHVPSLKTNVMAMPEFDETPQEIRAEIKINNYLNQGGLHPMNISLNDTMTYLWWHPNLSNSVRGRLLTQLHERVATPLTCLVVALIAIPFGAAPGRRNLFFGIAGSIAICFTFFVLQRVGMALGSGGILPAWLAGWLPNIFFSLLGVGMMARIR